MEPIAQKPMSVVNRETGEYIDVVVEIFAPRQADEQGNNFCLARLTGIEGESYDVGGADSLQALLLALNQIKKRFTVLQEEKYNFFWPDSKYPIKSLDHSVESEIVQKKVEKAKKYLAEPERFTVNGTEVTLRSDHGVRHLTLVAEKWVCDCDFYIENTFCSHSIAVKGV